MPDPEEIYSTTLGATNVSDSSIHYPTSETVMEISSLLINTMSNLKMGTSFLSTSTSNCKFFKILFNSFWHHSFQSQMEFKTINMQQSIIQIQRWGWKQKPCLPGHVKLHANPSHNWHLTTYLHYSQHPSKKGNQTLTPILKNLKRKISLLTKPLTKCLLIRHPLAPAHSIAPN